MFRLLEMDMDLYVSAPSIWIIVGVVCEALLSFYPVLCLFYFFVALAECIPLLISDVITCCFNFLLILVSFISEIVPLLLTIAVATLVERRVMASSQRRRGPDETGLHGLIQPVADGLKLFLKEIFSTSNSNTAIFMASPFFMLFFTLFFWCLVPGSDSFSLVELEYVLFVFLIVGTFNVHTVIFSGWSSNSKYAFLGAIRAASQMISYEICLGTVISSLMLMTSSYSLLEIVHSQFDIIFSCPLLPIWVLFMISALAETNRTPFDLVESEAELVSGYNVEYSASFFASFFISEYGNVIVMCTMSTLCFFGGWLLPFCNDFEECVMISASSAVYACKTAVFVFFFILVRAAVPRYRYDQLMSIGWKVLLPIGLSLLLIQAGLMNVLDLFVVGDYSTFF
jgi:NADH-quinone oxidoreductase subunit H